MEVFNATEEEQPIPHLSDRLRWFEYFDDDHRFVVAREVLSLVSSYEPLKFYIIRIYSPTTIHSETLSQEELVRAIVKTLDLKPPWTTDEANKVPTSVPYRGLTLTYLP